MDSTRQILDILGRHDVAAALGVTYFRVERATRAKQLPASWFDALEKMAGQSLPRHLFAFKYGKTETPVVLEHDVSEETK
jgi:hypothetical protein